VEGLAVTDPGLQDFPPANALQQGRKPVSDHTYRVTEVVGTSPDSVQVAIRNGIARAAETLHNLEWFEATEIRGHIVDGQVEHFQVTMKVGFRLDEVSS
jgi:flavin-binding protein dodecin